MGLLVWAEDQLKSFKWFKLCFSLERFFLPRPLAACEALELNGKGARPRYGLCGQWRVHPAHITELQGAARSTAQLHTTTDRRTGPSLTFTLYKEISLLHGHKCNDKMSKWALFQKTIELPISYLVYKHPNYKGNSWVTYLEHFPVSSKSLTLNKIALHSWTTRELTVFKE